MASNPLFITPDFFFAFSQNELCYGYFGLKEMTANRAEPFLDLPKGIFPFPSNLR